MAEQQPRQDRAVEIAQLEMFVAVVEERNIRRAAERLFRTQPVVSIALKKLEEQTGAVLLTRARGQASRLTSAGELFYEFTSRMIAVRDEAVSRVRGREEQLCRTPLDRYERKQNFGTSRAAAL
jgi:DNA-binding transcriptional LysR family regulator